jgi:dihydroorotate dehydrogenase (NAD+) catalytic subunit
MINLSPNNPYTLELRSPLIAAAGCFGLGVEYERSVPIDQIGAIVTRGTALRGQLREPLLLTETAGGVLSQHWPVISFASIVERYVPQWATWRTPVIVNVVADHAAIAVATEGIEGIAGLELWLPDANEAARITAAARAATHLPLIAKLTLHDNLLATARACASAGADALTLIGPLPASVSHSDQGLRSGWLSGPAILPLALRCVASIVDSMDTPVIACGGVFGRADIQAYLAAGARAVQIGTALLANPQLVCEQG